MAQPATRRLSFNNAAVVYDEIRPTYPPALYDDLFADLRPEPHVVEVGPGTGQATRDLLAHGAHVHAIEIAPAMAEMLRNNLPSTDLTITISDFESADIAPRSADAIFSATAYHWVSPDAQLGRPARILEHGGMLAIVDLVQVKSPDDQGFFTAAQPIYDRYGQSHEGPPAPTRDRVDPAIRQLLADDQRFVDAKLRTYDWNQTYSAASYRKLMLSYSGTQTMSDEARLGLLDDIETFINEEFSGEVIRPLVVALSTARLTTPAH
jgi:SAM-dependent methyltransferase